MSEEIKKEVSFTNQNCRPRFKAVEGFLRRVAFNLGNTPSQTGVKIISCIPIDVTDLQQRIVQLEKELKLSKKKHNNWQNKRSSMKTTTVQTLTCKDNSVLCPSRSQETPDAEVTCDDGFCRNSRSQVGDSGCCPINRRISSFTFMYPSERLGHICPNFEESYEDRYKPSQEKRKKGFLSKIKRENRSKCNSHLVYRSQIKTKSPFKIFCSRSDNTSRITNEIPGSSPPFTPSYLADIVGRQYAGRAITTDLSEFSVPVCRDNVTHTHATGTVYESDGDCHEQFQNVDDQINKQNNAYNHNLYPTCENVLNRSNEYYDHNFYDLVPVKEKPVKITNETAARKRKEPRQPAAKLSSHKKRNMYMGPHTTVNYCSVVPVNECKRSPLQNQMMAQAKNIMSTKRASGNRLQPDRDVDSSNMLKVDLGPVYSKYVGSYKMMTSSTPGRTQNNATCSGIDKNTIDCQTTVAPAPAVTPAEDKTEATLNQIKSILQSVLAEVKTKSRLEKQVPKRDAVVQKEFTQSVLEETHPMQSSTYSPYNMNPYVASCSHHIPSTHITYPMMQDNCMHHYPLLIHSQKQTCNNCIRRNDAANFGSDHRAAAGAAYTGQARKRSKETEHLIKEIYKSIALNAEFPESNTTKASKEVINSLKNFAPPQSSKETSIDRISPSRSIAKKIRQLKNVESKNISATVSEIFRNRKPMDSTITRGTDITSRSKLSSNITGFGSGYTANQHRVAVDMRDYLETICSDDTESIDNRNTRPPRASKPEKREPSEVSEDSSTETENDSSKIEVKKQEKIGIFKKMMNIFKSRRRGKNEAGQESEASESDSDDYQTVCSHKAVDHTPKMVKYVRSRPHSKVFYSKLLQKRSNSTRSPQRRSSSYMEQESRRFWDEQVVFHESQSNRCYEQRPRHAASSPRGIHFHSPGRGTVPEGGARRCPRYIGQSVTCPRSTCQYGGNRAVYRPQCYTETRPKYTGTCPQHSSSSRTGSKPRFTASKRVTSRGKMTSNRPTWPKKRQLGIKCGPMWKDMLVNG